MADSCLYLAFRTAAGSVRLGQWPAAEEGSRALGDTPPWKQQWCPEPEQPFSG